MKALLLKLEPLIWFMFGQGILIGTILLTAWLLVVGLAIPMGIVDADAPESIHHCQWPVADEALIDQSLLDQMALTRRIASLGLSARSSANIKVRLVVYRDNKPVRFRINEIADGRALSPLYN